MFRQDRARSIIRVILLLGIAGLWLNVGEQKAEAGRVGNFFRWIFGWYHRLPGREKLLEAVFHGTTALAPNVHIEGHIHPDHPHHTTHPGGATGGRPGASSGGSGGGKPGGPGGGSGGSSIRIPPQKPPPKPPKLSPPLGPPPKPPVSPPKPPRGIPPGNQPNQFRGGGGGPRGMGFLALVGLAWSAGELGAAGFDNWITGQSEFYDRTMQQAYENYQPGDGFSAAGLMHAVHGPPKNPRPVYVPPPYTPPVQPVQPARPTTPTGDVRGSWLDGGPPRRSTAESAEIAAVIAASINLQRQLIQARAIATISVDHQ